MRLTTDTKINLRDTEYGFDLRPGIVIACNTLFYGRLGAAFNKLKLDTRSDLITASPNATANSGSIDSFVLSEKDKDVTGLRLALGVEQYLCRNLAVNLDYVWTNYGHIKTNSTGNVTSASGPTGIILTEENAFSAISSAKVTTNQVLLGVIIGIRNC